MLIYNLTSLNSSLLLLILQLKNSAYLLFVKMKKKYHSIQFLTRRLEEGCGI